MDTTNTVDDITTPELITSYWSDAKAMSDRELLEAMYVNTCEAKAAVDLIMAKVGEVMAGLEDNPMLGMLLGSKKGRR